MANEDMIGSSIGQSRVHDEGTHSRQAQPTAGDVKSAVPTMAEDYTERAGAALDEAKKRVRTLREDTEDYVRTNPMKAVLVSLGVGFTLGLISRH